MATARQVAAWKPRFRWQALLLLVYTVTYCTSLRYVTEHYSASFPAAGFNEASLVAAAINVAIFAIVWPLFIWSRFSFGYFVGFYSYSLILGYAWFAKFSIFHYDHSLASLSALASILAFLGPALFITSPLPRKFVPSDRAFDLLLSCILIVAVITIAAGAFYNFRIVGITDIYGFRDGLEFPKLLKYAVGITPTALLPFAFACYVARGDRWRAAASLLLLLMFYPVTLTKLTFFAPFWLLFLMLLSEFFREKAVTMLSLFLPTVVGLIALALSKAEIMPYINPVFGNINFRMIAIPSMALDVYNDFFSRHAFTYFCQISPLKSLLGCLYTDPLSVIMEKTYHAGNLNASLFATEGVASVGPIFAPLTALVCGLIISIANRVSSDLPPKFVLLSSGLLVQVFLNVPFTTTLLTNGGGILFVLWYLTPRAMFVPNQASLANEPASPYQPLAGAQCPPQITVPQ